MAEQKQSDGRAQIPNVYAFPPPRQAGVPLYVGQLTRTELRDTIVYAIILSQVLVGILVALLFAVLLLVRG